MREVLRLVARLTRWYYRAARRKRLSVKKTTAVATLPFPADRVNSAPDWRRMPLPTLPSEITT